MWSLNSYCLCRFNWFAVCVSSLGGRRRAISSPLFLMMRVHTLSHTRVSSDDAISNSDSNSNCNCGQSTSTKNIYMHARLYYELQLAVDNSTTHTNISKIHRPGLSAKAICISVSTTLPIANLKRETDDFQP